MKPLTRRYCELQSEISARYADAHRLSWEAEQISPDDAPKDDPDLYLRLEAQARETAAAWLVLAGKTEEREAEVGAPAA